MAPEYTLKLEFTAAEVVKLRTMLWHLIGDDVSTMDASLAAEILQEMNEDE